jgi:hypothetical protein
MGSLIVRRKNFYEREKSIILTHIITAFFVPLGQNVSLEYGKA